MTHTETLVRLGETASAAVLAALAELGVDDVQQGSVSAPEEAGSAFDGFELPVQAATVAELGAGRTTLVLTQSGSARLAAEAAGEGQPADLGLLAETLGKLAAAAAAAAASQLGSVASGAPQVRLVAEPDPAESWEAGAPVAIVSLTICEEPATLVLVVPVEVLEQLDAVESVPYIADVEEFGTEGSISEESLREVKVRLWIELGRTRMALGRAVGLAPGEVVELDAAVDEPVIIFVNGVRLGTGHLVVGDDGEWAFRVVEVSARSIVSKAALHGQAGDPEGSAPPGAEHATVDRKDA